MSVQTNTLYLDIENLLKSIPDFVTEEKELRYNKIKEMAENGDVKLLEPLLKDEKIKSAFFTPILDSFIFKTKDFKEFLDYSSSNNSYSQFLGKKIGLYTGDSALTDRSEVVLNFPFKDCVLEGGQRKEDGLDVYFSYDEKTGDYVEKTDKRREVFFNETLAKDEIDSLFSPKAFCNVKKFTKDGEETCTKFERNAELNRKRGLSEDTITDNLVIKGNNLLALHSLKKEFERKVKLIYIDPPYNTGSDDFKYNDNFNHSSWLTFMKNRLEVARDLLRDDGCIFVQCDDNEQAYLKVLLDEVFGFENFVNTIAVKMSPSSGVKRRFANIKFIKNKEFLLLYKKNKLLIKPLNDVINDFDENYTIYFDGNEFCPLSDKIGKINSLYEKLPTNSYYNFPEIKEFIQKNSIFIYRRHGPSKWAVQNIKKENIVFERTVKKESRNFVYEIINPENKDEKELLFDIKKGNYERLEPLEWKLNSDKEITLLRGDFWNCGFEGDIGNVGKEGSVDFGQGKKPERLIQDVVRSVTKESDIVLDYHLGSGTTAAVSHKMNRQYIGVEQLDYGENDSVVRLKNVINGDTTGISKSVNWQGGGSFVYLELAEKNEKAMRLISACKNYEELISIFENLSTKYFLHYNVRVNEFINTICKEDNFKKLSLERQKEIFMRMMDLNQLYVNCDDRNDKDSGLTENDIKATEDFYQISKDGQ